MTALAFSILAFLSTLAGGLFVMRFQRQLHFILSFTAGVLLGVVCFDLLPEIFSLSGEAGVNPVHAMVALVGGFLLFHSLEKFFVVHTHEPGCADSAHHHHHHPRKGVFSALALSGHSFMDGVGIGLAFQVSPTMGFAVALAVIAHDFCDGLNTAGLMIAHRNTSRSTFLLLLVDAAAPLLGAASTYMFHAPPALVTYYLGFFAGFLLYIGAADILPEAHARRAAHPAGLVSLTALGAAVVYIVVHTGAAIP